MKKFVVLLLLSLLIPIKTFSQDTLTTITITPEQLKLTNLIFAEHKKFSEEIPLLKTEINLLQESNENLMKIDSLRCEEIIQYKASNESLKKSIKTKNKLITGLGSGFLISLLIAILK